MREDRGSGCGRGFACKYRAPMSSVSKPSFSAVHATSWGLTLPSRGRPTSGFASCRPPLMSNVRALMSHHVFVFGTLKEGFPNFTVNKGLRVAGEFATVQRLPLYLVGERHSPWLINAPGQGHQVVGQVFQVNGVVLEEM